MLFVNYDIYADTEEIINALSCNDEIVDAEKFDVSKGYPKITVRKNGKTVIIKCEYTGRARKDNGFLEGTFFIGRLTEKCGVSRLKGLILTAPIYHSVILAILGVFVYKCISLGGFSIVPLCLLAFSIYMFKDEFRKQRIIKRYIFRAFKIVFSRKIYK